MVNESTPLRQKSSKGRLTYEAIVTEGVNLSREIGVSGLSVGSLAERVGMSKSGLFAHFGSKEELQIAVLKAVQDEFRVHVFQPALKQPRGLSRLRALINLWLEWSGGVSQCGGCPILAASYEFDDRPGPVNDHVQQAERDMLAALRRSISMAVEANELPTDTHIEQFAFDIFGALLAAQVHARLLRDPKAAPLAVATLEHLIAHPPKLNPDSIQS